MEQGLTEFELGWLAGLMEGEGYFGLRSDTHTAQVKLEMTDEDVVLRALLLIQRITGRQHAITHVERKEKRNNLQTYVIAIYSKDAIKVMKKLIKYMGTRRRRKIWQTLNRYREDKTPKAKVDLTTILDELKLKRAVVIPLRRPA